MGDTSLVQLRDAIDVIIGKLDSKIGEVSYDQSLNKSGNAVFPRQLTRCKERAISNDFLSRKSPQAKQ